MGSEEEGEGGGGAFTTRARGRDMPAAERGRSARPLPRPPDSDWAGPPPCSIEILPAAATDSRYYLRLPRRADRP